MTRPTRLAVLVAALVALGLAGCGDNDKSASESATTSATAATGSIEVSDQASDGKTLKIASVTIQGAPGWMAIHTDQDGQPGPVAGKAPVPEGTTKDLVVTLDEAVTTGAFWPMLHVDAGTKGTYEFPGPDGPVKSGSEIVMKKITLTVK